MKKMITAILAIGIAIGIANVVPTFAATLDNPIETEADKITSIQDDQVFIEMMNWVADQDDPQAVADLLIELKDRDEDNVIVVYFEHGLLGHKILGLIFPVLNYDTWDRSNSDTFNKYNDTMKEVYEIFQ